MNKIIKNCCHLVAIVFVASLLTGMHAFSEDRPVVVLSRTECRGACPAYSVAIYEDGRVEWNGTWLVATRGRAAGTIARAQVSSLMRAFQDAGFSLFKDSYTSSCSPNGLCIQTVDASTTTITLQQNGTAKRVSFTGELGPQQLHALADLTDRIANTHQWIHNREARLSIDYRGYDREFPEDLKSQPTVIVDHAYHSNVTSLMKHSAAYGLDLLRQDLAEGIDVNQQDEAGWTALMYAAVGNNAAAVQTLLQNGATADLQDNNGDTALIGVAAQRYSTPKIVTSLIANGATVNRTNNYGETALMWAAWSGNSDTMRLLLAAGADACKTDHEGRSAMAYAKRARDLTAKQLSESTRFEQVLAILGQVKPCR